MAENDTEEQIVHKDEWQLLKDAFLVHGRQVTLGAGVVLIVIVAIFVYSGRTRGRIEKASTQFANARSLEDLEVLIEEYPSTPTAPLALLKVAKGYFNSGNYDTAFNKYSDFQRTFTEHAMIETAEVGKIHCMEAKGQTEEAIAAFASFAAKHPDHYLTPQAILGQGRCLEQINRHDEARKIYEGFIDEYSESEWLSKAEDLLERLDKRLKKKQVEAQPARSEQEEETKEAVPANQDD